MRTAYALGLVALVLAVLLRWALDPLMGDALSLVTLFGAVAASVWLGGYRVAIPVTLVVGLIAYLFTCTLIIAFGEATRIAETRAYERREVFRVTLQSIGDAVISTDIHGRITVLNEVAESLTGWSHEDALGQSLDRVFNIVNEATPSQSRIQLPEHCVKESSSVWQTTPC